MVAVGAGDIAILGRESMVSIEDVAQRAGVSVATVSRALRGLPNVAAATRERVAAAARELHYVGDPAAARLAGGRTGTIGLVLPGIGSWFHATIMDAVHQVAVAERYDVLAFVVSDRAAFDDFLDALPYRKRVDGLVIVDIPFREDGFERIGSSRIPFVTIGADRAPGASVGIDDRGAARELVEHLIELGHTDIAVIDGGPLSFPGPRARLAGVLDGLRQHGLDLPEQRHLTGAWRAADGAAAIRELLGRGAPPTAVLAFSDEMAIGAIGELREQGFDVPRDISVVGFDGHDLAAHVGLTTVEQPVAAMGARVASLLLRQIVGDESRTGHHVLPTRLRLRDTTAVPRERALQPSAKQTDRRPSNT